MSAKEQKRQKKLAKKRSKEIAKRKQQSREKSLMQSLAGQMQTAGRGAVDRCLISDRLFEKYTGIGSVLISRFLPDGRLGCVRFLIDALCLGVKDVDGFAAYPADFSKYLERSSDTEPLRPCTPAKARKYVESAIAYAAKFGLEPTADYAKVEAIWTGIDPNECDETFEFGDEDGKPRYINGPFDSQLFQQKVLEKLRVNAGEGNFHYIMQLRGDEVPMISPYASDEDGGWMDDPELDVDIDEDVEFDPNTVDGRVINPNAPQS